jgi:hypothetical protein
MFGVCKHTAEMKSDIRVKQSDVILLWHTAVMKMKIFASGSKSIFNSLSRWRVDRSGIQD